LIRAGGFAAGHDGDEVLEMMLGPYAEDTDHPWHRVERGEIPLSEYGGWLVAEAKSRNITLPGNIAREAGDHWRAIVPVDELFDLVIDSSHVGMRKPNPAIYTYAAEQLGVAPERCVFLDDAAGNIAGAEAVGMRAIFVDLDIAPALAELDDVLAGTTT
jgi:FMN phosphatase YigB (HAD superfamily)